MYETYINNIKLNFYSNQLYMTTWKKMYNIDDIKNINFMYFLFILLIYSN